MRLVLFLCSGNYYRSRYAEALFNHWAVEARLVWRAHSRGLSPGDFARNPGHLSPLVVEALHAHGMVVDVARGPIAVDEDDFATAERVVALQRIEHRPMIGARFPTWLEQVVYWDVPDVEDALPAVTLSLIETEVRALIRDLAARA